TRFSRDWSSDVCSSDLRQIVPQAVNFVEQCQDGGTVIVAQALDVVAPDGHITGCYAGICSHEEQNRLSFRKGAQCQLRFIAKSEIGRASCRERREAEVV